MSDSLRVVVKVAGLAVLIFTLSLGLAMGLAGCGADDGSTGTTGIVVTTQGNGSATTAPASSEGALVGKWQSQTLGETIEFTTDGKMIVSKEGETDIIFSYAAEGGMLTLTLEATAGEASVAYTIEGDTLTIEDPEMGPTPYSRVQ